MLIRHLDFLVALAEERHFGRAADLCGVSQPALSLAIRKLEEDLGAPLIIRGRRFMGLTAEGEKALAWGRRILADYEGLRGDLDGRRKGGVTGVLRLGVLSSAAPLVPAVSARFEARNPLARISIEPRSAEAILEGLHDFTLDGALTRLAEGARKPAPGLLWTPLWRERPLFACRRDHPFADSPSLTWRDAATQPICATEDMARRELDSRGIRPAILCASLGEVLAHLREGLWCALAPESFRKLLAEEDEITLHDLGRPDLRPTLGILALDREPRSGVTQALLDCAEALSEEARRAELV